MTDTDKAPKWRFTTKLALYAAGWRPTRNQWSQLKLPQSFAPFPAAQSVLSKFGGLRFGSRTESVVLEPALGEEVANEIKAFERLLGLRLFPVGVMEHQDRHYLLVDEQGVVYTLIDELEPLASSFHRAIEYLVRGKADRREVDEDLAAAGIARKSWRLDNQP
jgi:hypothetical protein